MAQPSVFRWTYNPAFRIDLGGSTTAGEEVREAETYPAQLEAILRARYPGRRFRVMNGGVPACDTRDSFLLQSNYRALVREIKAGGPTPIAITHAISYAGNIDATERRKVEASLGTVLPHRSPEVRRRIVELRNRPAPSPRTDGISSTSAT